MTGNYEPTESGRRKSGATRGASYRAQFDPADGTGDWSIAIPAGADKHDVLALGPVIDGIKSFLAPTVQQPDEPIGYELTEGIPDLTA